MYDKIATYSCNQWESKSRQEAQQLSNTDQFVKQTCKFLFEVPHYIPILSTASLMTIKMV